MGEVKVPKDALYAAQTQRAVDNFGLRQRRMPPRFVHSLALVKQAAARANRDCGVLEGDIASALDRAATRVAAGEFDEQFPVSLFQTGSGTSTNMNMNEVLAHLASASCGHEVHPNDHANCSQSSNDVIPSAILVTAARALEEQLAPAMAALESALAERAQDLHDLTKTGRTHLMDAMPLTFGQEISAWASQVEECRQRFADLRPRLLRLPLGGSAVGTGVNVPAGYAKRAAEHLSDIQGQTFSPADNAFARMAGQDSALECSACLRALAVTLSKVNNDLRWMSSGPLSGLAEISLRPLQPGSSIMPGKVNPVLPEAVLMICAEVIGDDACVALAAQSGSFQLNVMLPLIAAKLCSGFETLSWACVATAESVAGFTVNRDRVEATLASNPILVTALNQRIGYEAAAVIAKRSYAERRPVLDVAAEETGLDRAELERLLDPYRLTQNPDSKA
ncbi:class II fumarate hydratase [Pseudohalioglobus sediminis]|uniref:Class II fumarate hydratase n=1 Tax=Pseudohalioglobus sediminis TaxID=2606449 RepID=A0A5B0X8V9_9GAMM|nr:class II fumarate hydratase [Pseudohalioglobus sediminis]KAA1194609.1 class II fumarate hydratase [Pseudohalioglobus sediminis]